jgi:hypothetical protein
MDDKLLEFRDDYGNDVTVSLGRTFDDRDMLKRSVILQIKGPEAQGELCFTIPQIAELKAVLHDIETPHLQLNSLENDVWAATYASYMERYLSGARWEDLQQDDVEGLRKKDLAHAVARAKQLAVNAVKALRGYTDLDPLP